jgi:hypothetical protein
MNQGERVAHPATVAHQALVAQHWWRPPQLVSGRQTVQAMPNHRQAQCTQCSSRPPWRVLRSVAAPCQDTINHQTTRTPLPQVNHAKTTSLVYARLLRPSFYQLPGVQAKPPTTSGAAGSPTRADMLTHSACKIGWHARCMRQPSTAVNLTPT